MHLTTLRGSSLTTLLGGAFVLTILVTTGLGCSNSVPDEGVSPQIEVRADSDTAAADVEDPPAAESEEPPSPKLDPVASGAPSASPIPSSTAGGAVATPAGKTCKSAADCAKGEQCFGPQGCDAIWTCGPPRACTRDLVTFCGCDGTEFRGSGSCPSRPYRARGQCP